jgi:hypothetical protein
MSAILVTPKPFTVVSGNASGTAPVSNANIDEPAMVWRSANLTTVYAKVQLDGTAWDTIALVGSNLRAGDTIRVRAGATAAAVDGTTGLTVDQTFAAWSGVAPTKGALSFKLLGASVTSPFVRIDITSTGNPAGYVEVSRIVLGLRVAHDGVGVGAEQTFEDMSVIEEGPGYTTVDRYGVRIAWKITLDGITDAMYYTNWFPFLRDVGKSKAFVFIPDDSVSYIQNQAIFGRLSGSPAKGSSPVENFNIVEFVVLSVS